MTTEAMPLAAVLLAHDATAADAGRIEAMVAAARQAGAATVVVVLPAGMAPPPEARIARVKAGTATLGAVRAGMALLTNTTARLALVWPLEASDAAADADALSALVDAARRNGSAATTYAAHDPDRSPLIVGRDGWLELMAGRGNFTVNGERFTVNGFR